MKRLPWTLYRYLGRELIISFLFAEVVLTLIFMIIFGLKGVSKGLSVSIIYSWLSDSVWLTFFYTLPVSLLSASCFCYGRWVADREYTATAAAGISPLHLFMPQAAFASTLMGIAYAAHGTLLPYASYVQRDFSRYVYQQLESLGDQREGQIPIDQDSVVYFDEVRGGTKLRGLHIETSRKWKELAPDQPPPTEKDDTAAAKNIDDMLVPVVIKALRAEIQVIQAQDQIKLLLEGVEIRLADPQSAEERGTNLRFFRSWEGAQVGSLSLTFQPNQRARRAKDQPNTALLAEIAKLEQLAAPAELAAPARAAFLREAESLRSEYWERKAKVFSIFSFALLGFPISLVFRFRHRLMSLFVCFSIVALTYYPLLLSGETLAVQLGVPAGVAMMAGNYLLLAISLPLLGRVLLR
ncbi:MAG: LptF/LptG family permease [Planctomycetota bacterium]